MPDRKIVKIGNPSLLQKSKTVENFNDAVLYQLIADLKTIQDDSQAVGIAAPQIGVQLRVIIVGFKGSNPRYPNEAPFPIRALINPSFKPLSDKVELAWEGCLSVPNMRGLVERYSDIEYTAYDEKGELITGKAHGFMSRVIQHEIDHLDGILFPHRLKQPEYFGMYDELATIEFDYRQLNKQM